MAMVNFKKGLLAGLPSTYAEGTFYVTTDERAIYLDVSDSQRIRLGDFQEFATLDALKANVNPSTSALYYVADINVMAKWDGSQYRQINLDTGATSIEVVGTGNAVTAASYDAATRKLTLTMGETFATKAEHDELAEFVGEIPEGYNQETVIAYINKKAEETLTAAQGGSSETAASVKGQLDTYKSETDPRLEALEEDTHTHANKAELDKIAEGDKAKWDAMEQNAKDYTDETIEGLKLAETYEPIGTGATEAGKVQAKLDDEVLRAKGEEQKNAQAAADALAEAQAKVASVTAGDASVTVAGTSTAPTVAVKLDPAADNAIKLGDAGLKVEIGAAPEYSIVKAADSGEYAAVYNLTKDGAVVGTSINIPKDLVVKSGSVVGDEIVLVLNDEANTEIKIDVASLIEYVTSGSQTGDMVVVNVSDDHKVTATITDGTITLAKLATDVQTAIGKAHSHENADVLAGISADKVAAWDAAEQNAKDYADGLNTAMDGRVKAIEDDYLKGADKTELSDAIAGEKTRAEGIEAGLNTRLGAVEADYLKGADKTELEGKITAAQEAAEKVANDNNSAMDTRVKVLEAIDHDAYVAADEQVLSDAKAYADQAETDAVATANAHTESLLQWGSF